MFPGEPSIRVDSGGHIYVTGPVGVPTGGCPLWDVHPDTLNAHGKAPWGGTIGSASASPE